MHQGGVLAGRQTIDALNQLAEHCEYIVRSVLSLPARDQRWITCHQCPHVLGGQQPGVVAAIVGESETGGGGGKSGAK